MIECCVRTNSRIRFWERVYRCPDLSAKSLLLTPNFCSPEICCRINSVVYGVAMIGALYRCASFGIAPMWSRCPWEQTIALTVPSTAFIIVSSGIALILIRSRECIFSISASSWIITWSRRSPMSKMTISFPQRTAVIFRPTSSYPPTAIISISIVVSPESMFGYSS